MQETGTVKNRDVSVEYADAEGAGTVTAQIGLLKSAPVRLVVEKPGVERMILPINLGSLNGTIKGRVLLQVVDYRLPGTPTRLPLQNAKVKLDGDEKILKWAAVDDARHRRGRRVHRSRCGWPTGSGGTRSSPSRSWSARRPNSSARQFNCLKHLSEWPASEAVKGKGEHFVLGAQRRAGRARAGRGRGVGASSCASSA